jgi:hypothetical protein
MSYEEEDTCHIELFMAHCRCTALTVVPVCLSMPVCRVKL